MPLPDFSVPQLAHLHGQHYTEAQFNAEVRERSAEHHEEDMPPEDINNIFLNVARDLYREWNELEFGDPVAMKFERELSERLLFGFQTADEVRAGGSGLMDPVHGITLEDWAGANAKLASGADIAGLLTVLGVERPQWDEAGAIWMARMSGDTTHSIAMAYGNAFTNSNIGKFANSAVGMAVPVDSPAKAAAKDSLELYSEIFSAQSTAYQFGVDGSQYIKDHFGLTLGDWGEISGHWGQRLRDELEMTLEHGRLIERYNEQYQQQFAAAQGGNVGDDIEF